MSSITTLAMVACVSVGLTTAAWADGKKASKTSAKKVLVQDLGARGVSAEQASAISTAACTAFSKQKGYEVVCGEDLRALMKWNAMAAQLDACSSNDCYDAAGKALKARFVVSGNVAKVTDELVLTLAMFDVKRGAAVGRAEVKASDLKGLHGQIAEAIDVLLSAKK